jgi:hypothetical protein
MKSKCATCGNCQIISYAEYPGASQTREETCSVDEDGGEDCPKYQDITALLQAEEEADIAMQIKADRRDKEFYFDLTGQDEERFYGED